MKKKLDEQEDLIDSINDDVKKGLNLSNKSESSKNDKIKELKSFKIPNEKETYSLEILGILILNDNRILLNIEYKSNNKDNKSIYKYIIYNTKNNEIFNLKLDMCIYDFEKDIVQIDNDKIIILSRKRDEKSFYLFDINQNKIIQTFNLENISDLEIVKLTDLKIGIFYTKKKELILKYDIYSYENGKLFFNKTNNIKEKTYSFKICIINENEVAFTIFNDALFGSINYHYVLFYNLKKNKKIKTLNGDMYKINLINKNIFSCITFDNEFILIGIDKKNILKKIKFENYFDYLIPFTEKIFLICGADSIYQYIIKDGNDIILKQELKIQYDTIKKYINNEIIIGYKDTIKIYDLTD